jgi:hypothetical protein
VVLDTTVFHQMGDSQLVDTSSISVVGVRFLVMMYGPRTEW